MTKVISILKLLILGLILKSCVSSSPKFSQNPQIQDNIDPQFQELYYTEIRLASQLCKDTLYKDDQQLLDICLKLTESIKYYGIIIQFLLETDSPVPIYTHSREYIVIKYISNIIKYKDLIDKQAYSDYILLGQQTCSKYLSADRTYCDFLALVGSQLENCDGLQNAYLQVVQQNCRDIYNQNQMQNLEDSYANDYNMNILNQIYGKHYNKIQGKIPYMPGSYFNSAQGCQIFNIGCMTISPFSKIPLTIPQQISACMGLTKLCDQNIEYLKQSTQNYIQQKSILRIANFVQNRTINNLGCITLSQFCNFQMSEFNSCTYLGCISSYIYPQCSYQCNNKVFDYVSLCNKILYSKESVCSSQ